MGAFWDPLSALQATKYGKGDPKLELFRQPCREVDIGWRSEWLRVVPEFHFRLKVQQIDVFSQGANIAILRSKMIPEGTQSELLGPLWGALGHQWGHFDAPVPFQSPFETLSKINRNFGDFRAFPGGARDDRRPAPRAAKNAHFRQK